jgi:hypothetical protein
MAESDAWDPEVRARSIARALLLLVAGAIGLSILGRYPGTVSIDAEPPAEMEDYFELTEAPPSTISIPLAVPLDVLVDLLDEGVPRVYGTADSLRALPRRGRTQVSVALERSPFRATLANGVAHVEATLAYGLRVSYSLPALPDVSSSCGLEGDTRPRLAIAIESPLSIDRDWSLRTRARLVDLRPASTVGRDRCEVTFLDLDVTGQVVEGARSFVGQHLRSIDARAARVDTRSRFERWWATLQRPIQLGDSLWLALGPEAIQRGPVGGTGDSVTVALALRAHPRIVLGPEPRSLSPRLPPLDSGDVEPHLDLVVDGRADHGLGSRFLSERLAGTELAVGSRTVRIESVHVYGIGGGRLTVEVRVSGGIRGRLFLTGRPSVDVETGRIAVPDLDFDVSTGRAMLDVVPYIATQPLRNFLREEASWPLDPALQWLAAWLRRGLNRDLSDELRVTGVVDSVAIVAVYPFRDALLVRMSAKGSASLVVVSNGGR